MLVRSRTVLRGSLLLLTATLAAVPATHSTTMWAVPRLLAGAASALVFVMTVSALLHQLREHHAGPGPGPGPGPALLTDRRAVWWASAGLSAVLAAASAAALLRTGFPHRMVVVRHTVPEGQRESA
ncbi:hypothetical protein [Streptomyces sp. bgisy034]|uniref:hypothetical protein n=1 Tax=Streptomyces sp. bgisy034 TaxID=3413774 RepID=UPI003EBFDCC9